MRRRRSPTHAAPTLADSARLCAGRRVRDLDVAAVAVAYGKSGYLPPFIASQRFRGLRRRAAAAMISAVRALQ
jgi:hypothetical protein